MPNELPITGYLDRLSARPGEDIEVKVSVRGEGAYSARLVRVCSGDPNPDGPGVRFDDLSAQFHRRLQGRRQPIRLGSWGEALGPALDPAGAYCWTALIEPSTPPAGRVVIMSHIGQSTTLTLALEPEGVVAVLNTDGQASVVRADLRLTPRRWWRVWTSLDPATGRLTVGAASPPHLYSHAERILAERLVPGVGPPEGGVLRLAVCQPGAADTVFNGKIEDPAVLSGAHDRWDRPFASLAEIAADVVAAWDFGRDIDSQTFQALGPEGRDGRLCNLPMRAVVGARWTGEEHCWRHAPTHYAAIKFHPDDLGDCLWRTDFAFTVPADLRSGAYALHLVCEGGEDWLPFYVLGARGRAKGQRPAVVFLASTYTYQAYGNHARGNLDAAFRKRIADWGAYPYNADDYPIYGRSTYNLHPDGSGVGHASRLRPLLTMRPGYLTFVDPKGSGLRHYPADTHLLAWLDAKAIDYEIVTDEDIDREGEALLSQYRLVLTGSHPEYHTAGTLDALQGHVRGGGPALLSGRQRLLLANRPPS